MATTTLSVRDIAQKIKLPGEDMTAAINRARNWTREGLLPTVGEKHPGIGRERRYPQRAILDAVLLQLITSTLGIPAVIAKVAVKDVRKLLAEHPREGSVLVVGRSIGGKEWSAGIVWRSHLHKWIETRRDQVHAVINLETIYDLVDQGAAAVAVKGTATGTGTMTAHATVVTEGGDDGDHS